jgi:poly(A) polymerase
MRPFSANFLEAATMESKNPLKTSEEVYHRLRWDPALPASRVWIGYLDRMVGERELPLQEFTPGGRIPWGRIWFFRLDEERIWDRRTRMDRVFGSGDTPADQVLPRLQQHIQRADGVSAHPTYRYSADQDAWRPSKSPPEPLPSRLSVVTLNVLFDTYQPEALDSARRYAAIIEMLEEMSPDLIALQEVKRPFLEQLLDAFVAQFPGPGRLDAQLTVGPA